MKRFKGLMVLLLSLVLTFGLCACAGDGNDSGGELITDMIGRQVRVNAGAYERVVCIGAGALRMYCYVGDVDLLCGVEDIDNISLSSRPKMFDGVARPYVEAFGDTFKNLPSCGVGGPNAQTAEAEKILSCNPDIVISEYEDVEKANALQAQLGVPVITLRTGYDGVFDAAFEGSINLLGKIFGKTERASFLNDYVAAQRAEIERRTSNISERNKKNVYICGLGNWGTTDYLMTTQKYCAFEIANINNAVSGLATDAVQRIEAEKFVELGKDIDIMIIDAAAVKNIKPLYQDDNKIFDSCKAWSTGEVYLQMAYNAYYTNYEIALANAWFIAKTVYPAEFADVDIVQKTDEVTEAFLKVKLANRLFEYPQSYGGYIKIDTETFFA